MQRIKINLPEKFVFQTVIAVQIGDINYGNHLANDAVLRLCHEARLRFLAAYNYSELNIEGCGLIMADAAIQYINQAFYGDELRFYLGIGNIGRADFSLITQIVRQNDDKEIARIKNGMVFFDYQQQKVAQTPENFRKTFQAA